jgi:hypothetical protein
MKPTWYPWGVHITSEEVSKGRLKVVIEGGSQSIEDDRMLCWFYLFTRKIRIQQELFDTIWMGAKRNGVDYGVFSYSGWKPKEKKNAE